MAKTAIELAMERVAAGPALVVPRYFTYDAPHSQATIAEWQRALDAETYRGDKLSRLVIRWEAGDPWQPIRRYLIWQCVDPQHVVIEPWNRKALNGPSPRSRGHYCAPGWCFCELKANGWTGGATKMVDTATWRLYHDTGLYGQRWWTIQGAHGGHRYQWASDELAAAVAQVKGKPTQTPAPGDLPYAPFDRRVIRAIMAERHASALVDALKSIGATKAAMDREDQDAAHAKAQAVWDWAGDRVDELWDEGAELLPRYFEETHGRAPIGLRPDTNDEDLERRFFDAA